MAKGVRGREQCAGPHRADMASSGDTSEPSIGTLGRHHEQDTSTHANLKSDSGWVASLAPEILLWAGSRDPWMVGFPLKTAMPWAFLNHS